MHPQLAECALEPRASGSLHFELLSLLGRLLPFRRSPPDLGAPRLVNLCGGASVPGWVNAEFFKIDRHFLRVPRDHWGVDLRYPLPCPSDHWDGVLSEHTLEHLCPRDGLRFLRELHRTMKPGAWARVVVPDLAKYVAAYQGSPPSPEFSQWTGAELIWALTQNWGHRSVWDAELLGRTLREVGFVDVREVAFMEGTDARLLRDRADRAWESVYLEARKP